MGTVLRARQRVTKARAALLRLREHFGVMPITLARCRDLHCVEDFERARDNGLIAAGKANGDGTKSYAFTQRAYDYLARQRHV